MKHRLCWPFTPRVRLSHFYGRFHSCQLHFQTALIFTHFPPKKLLYVYVVQFCIMPTNLSIHYIFWKMYLTFAIARCKKDMGCALKISCLHKCKCCKQNLDLMLYLVPALRAIVLLLAIYYKRVLVMLVHSFPSSSSPRHTSGPYIFTR